MNCKKAHIMYKVFKLPPTVMISPKLSIIIVQKSGYGLFSIKERMADMVGSLEIVSEPGHGTKAIR